MRYFFALMMALSLSGCGADPAYPAADLSRVAAANIGRGETCGDNCGVWVEKYTRGQRVAWCAGFVSYVIREAGFKRPYTLRARDFYEKKSVFGVREVYPERGDVVVFKRGRTAGHAAIVDQVLDRDRFWIIEGNHGKYPARVKRSFVDTGRDYGREVLAFVKIK